MEKQLSKGWMNVDNVCYVVIKKGDNFDHKVSFMNKIVRNYTKLNDSY